MYQRNASMKPAAMDSREKVDLYDLIIFLKDAQACFESRKEDDVAFVMEMLGEYFEKDYKSKNKLVFSGRTVGL